MLAVHGNTSYVIKYVYHSVVESSRQIFTGTVKISLALYVRVHEFETFLSNDQRLSLDHHQL